MWQRLLYLIDQLLMILDLPTLDESPETRLRRLRMMYYRSADVNISYRRVKDVLRGHVPEEFHTSYERLLSSERAAKDIIKNLPSGARGDEMMLQMQNLGDKIAVLFDEAAQADKIIALYPHDSEAAQSVAIAKQWLIDRAEEALAVHTDIPAKLMSFKTAAADRGVTRFSERLDRLTNRLDDIADAYAELDRYNPSQLQNLIDTTASLDDTE